MKDIVWVVSQSIRYGSDNHMTATTNRSRAVRVYEANKGDADAFVSYYLERWENGHFVEHELETD